MKKDRVTRRKGKSSRRRIACKRCMKVFSTYSSNRWECYGCKPKAPPKSSVEFNIVKKSREKEDREKTSESNNLVVPGMCENISRQLEKAKKGIFDR